MEESQIPQKPVAAPPISPEQTARLDKYDDVERADIYRRASQIQADTMFLDDDAWTAEELAAGARGAGISDEALKRAIAERERDQKQAALDAQVAAKARAELRRKLLIGAVAAVAVGGLTTLATQAKLSGAYGQVETTRAQIDNNLQRRHDLIPNLIQVTKATLDNQSKLIAQLESANERARNAAPAQKAAAENDLSAVIAQATAQLKNSENDNVRDLVAEMAGSENRLAQSRRQYNNSVAQYNQKARGFPTTFVRPFLGYPGRIETTQVEATARETPKF